MRARFISILAVSALALAAFAQTGVIKTNITDVLKDPDKVDGKAIQVEGKVESYEEKTSQRGNPYTVFKVTDSGKTLSVWMTGHPKDPDKPKDGDKVQLTGIYRKEKKVGDVTFRNEIDVTPVKDKPYGIKVLERASGGN